MSHAQQLHNRRYLDGYIQIINRTGLPDNVKAEVCQQVHHAVLTTVQWTIERALEEELTAYLVLQRGFTPVGCLGRSGACDVRDTPHGFSAGDKPECPAPTACQTRAWARRLPTPSPPEATSLRGLFFNRRLMRTTKKCARITKVI